MTTTYPLPTLAPTINSSGISIPSYTDTYLSLVARFQAIYGSDIYLAPDSQDGQWLAVLAQAIYDSNLAAVTLFQSFAPSYAQGAQLSSLVKLNGLLRAISTNSTAVGNVAGVVGTTITEGVVQDDNGTLWNLPVSVVIPLSGTIEVTVTAQQTGAVEALSGTINKIATPQLGWQSFISTSDAALGAPVETDAALRVRQAASVAIPALTVKESIYAAIGNVTGVARLTIYENDTEFVDVNGLPAHSFSAVVQGGTVADIAAAIASRKPPGIQTYGSTTQTVYDRYGLPTPINFYVLATTRCYFTVTIKALTGYVSTTGEAIIAAVVSLVNALAVGEDVYAAQVAAAASLITLGVGQTFYLISLTLDTVPAPVATGNIVIAFNAAATAQTSDVGLVVT